MAVHPLSWLLRLAVLCHLALLLAGQQHSMERCSVICNPMAMTRKIPLDRLKSYRRTEPSCRTPAIIFMTKGNRTFCADPKEDWVQKAMQHLDRKEDRVGKAMEPLDPKAARLHGKQTDPRTSPATRGTDQSPASEPTATATTTTTTTTITTTTATSWQSSYQPTVDLGTEGKAFETASTQTPSTQTPSTQALPTQTLPTGTPSTQAPSTQTPSTQALPTQTLPTVIPSTQALPTQAASTQAPSTDTPSTQTPSTQAPSTQTLPMDTPSTQAPSTQAGSTQTPPTDTPSSQAPSSQAPTISHTAPDHGQDLTPENPLGSSSAHTDAVTGPGSTPRVSVAPSREPVATGSWAPTPRNPQRLGILSTPVTEATRRQAVGLLAFLGLLFCLGVGMFTYQRLQGCPRSAVGDMVEGLRYVPRGCGSNSYVLVPV
ncbi:fractalkine isoform X1 [Myotis daubentonii]|uniref:fractalkine isoform X1 n=2 Tax=Myotis daubentonii TaxID=98922 RepID=UPI0028736D41|nr:fractalkine isoform X1 [Myotis daubentonii]